MSRKRKKRQLRVIKPKEAARAIYFDFEGRAVSGEPPVLLGYCLSVADNAPPMVRQLLLDRTMVPLLELTPHLLLASLEDAVDELVHLSNDDKRHLVSWSLHDRHLVQEWTAHKAFRYRNAIPTAKKWRAGQRTDDAEGEFLFQGNDLQSYLALIGYQVPQGLRSGAGAWIKTARQRLDGAGGNVDHLSAGGRAAWLNLVEHNRHDVLGMRAVVRMATGLDLPSA